MVRLEANAFEGGKQPKAWPPWAFSLWAVLSLMGLLATALIIVCARDFSAFFAYGLLMVLLALPVQILALVLLLKRVFRPWQYGLVLLAWALPVGLSLVALFAIYNSRFNQPPPPLEIGRGIAAGRYIGIFRMQPEAPPAPGSLTEISVCPGPAFTDDQHCVVFLVNPTLGRVDRAVLEDLGQGLLKVSLIQVDEGKGERRIHTEMVRLP